MPLRWTPLLTGTFLVFMPSLQGCDNDERDEAASDQWVEIVAPNDDGECLPASDEPGSESLLACLNDGSVLKIVGGPRSPDGQGTAVRGGGTFWALSGFGWVDERNFEDHHRGGEPFPDRPDLAAGGLIAYVGLDHTGLWVMGADGSEKRRLSSEEIAAYTWSPNGEHIAYESESGLHVINLEGAVLLEVKEFVAGRDAYDWSPDGELIAYAADGELRVVGPDGAGELKISDVPDPASVAWSPDGEVIAVAASEEGVAGLVLYSLDGAVLLSSELDINGLAWSEGGWLVLTETLATGHSVPSLNIYYAEPTLEAIIPIPLDGAEYGTRESPPLWRPGAEAELAVAGRLLDLAARTTTALPRGLLDWSPDGEYGLIQPAPNFGVGIVRPGRRGDPAKSYGIFEVDSNMTRSTYGVAAGPSEELAAELAERGTFSASERQLRLDRGPYSHGTALAPGDVLVLETGGEFFYHATGGLVAFSVDRRYALFNSSSFNDLDSALESSIWIWIEEVETREITMLGEGLFPQWQPAASTE